MAADEHLGRVMASELRIVAIDPRPGQIDDARSFLDQLEQRWSRFLPTSDISRLNTRAGELVEVAHNTLVLLATMIEAWEVTGGRHDAGILPTLITNGYGTSVVDPQRTTVLPDTARFRPGAILDILLDQRNGEAALPVGLALDPGGIGKGLAADLTVARLLAGGARGALVCIGGDLAMAGDAPDAAGWIIAVEAPTGGDAELCTVAISGGGVATSSTRTRGWQLNGTARHHVIDTATAEQSETDLVAVTVVADTGWAAEAHATAALVAGRDHVLDYLASRGLDGLAVAVDGDVLQTAGLRALDTVAVNSGRGDPLHEMEP